MQILFNFFGTISFVWCVVLIFTVEKSAERITQLENKIDELNKERK